MRKTALLLVLILMISMLFSVANAETAEYTGSARGFGGMVEVKLTLDEGKIIEEGTYDELMAQNGAFAKLVERQQVEQK